MLLKASIDEHHVRTVHTMHPGHSLPHDDQGTESTLEGTFPGWAQSKKVMSLILDTDDHIFIADTTAELRDQLVSMIPASPTEERLVDLAAAVLGCDTLDIILTHG